MVGHSPCKIQSPVPNLLLPPPKLALFHDRSSKYISCDWSECVHVTHYPPHSQAPSKDGKKAGQADSGKAAAASKKKKKKSGKATNAPKAGLPGSDSDGEAQVCVLVAEQVQTI